MQNTVDVGPRFAEEARRIHYGEAEERAIRGQATSDEAESLRDEVDIEHLQAALVSVVEETMQPESVALWLRDTRS